MAGINIIRKWVMGQMTKKSDDGIMITLPDMKKVELNTNITIEKFLQNGINPNAFTNTQQVENAINQLNRPMTVNRPGKKGIMKTKTADIFEIATGKEIPKGSKIMGGQAVDDMPPPGSRGGKDDIAAPVQSSEETLKNMIEAENKKNINKIKERLKDKPEPEDKADGGRIGLKDGISLESILEDKIPSVKMPDPLQKILEKMTPEEKEMFKMRMEIMRRGFEINNPANPDAVKPVPMPTYPKENRADGGRIGYKKGSVDLARRGFMKAAAGVGAGIGALKMGALKLFGKEGTRQVTKQIIKTDNVPGKPEWFDALVTKVINEGEDMTKQFATKEREIVHATKIGKDDYVRVTQDLDDGTVRVEYESPDNVYGDQVVLEYKKPLPDEGDPRPVAEFTTAESGPVGRAYGPDDYELNVEEISGRSISDLDSDLSKLKIFATGKKPTLKEFVQNKKRKDKAARITDDIDGAASDAVIRRQGDFDPSDYEDFAKGGIARMLGE
tara:strand:+ start:42 stop:1541 length:1500 start_codon:yes stop_codon:yes gene_type:complete